MNSITEYNCANCNAELEFNPESQKWQCDYCLSGSNNKITSTPQRKTKVKKVIKTTSRTHRSNSGSTHGGGGDSF